MGTDLNRWTQMLAFAGLVFGFASNLPLQACQICLPIPTTSAAEYLLEADVVVLAREDPRKPFSLRTVEVLKGDPGEAKMELFLDSQSRRMLSFYPQRKIVCVYQSSGSNSGWLRIGTADSAFGPLVREILDRESGWKDRPKERVNYFAKYLGHKNPQVRTLAHLEVARSLHDEIKNFAGIIPTEDLRTFLKNFRLYEWHALYILLLAQSGEEQDHKLIVERVRSAERIGTVLQLAAWATGWIEIGKEAALDFLHERYLKNPDRPAEEVRPILAALSVHGSRGHTRLRDRIVEGYRSALENYPILAPQIVTDLFAWKRWDLAEPVAAIVNAPPPKLDRAALLQLRAYARQAEEHLVGASRGRGDADEKKGSVIILIVLGALILLPVGLGVHAKRNRRGGAGS